MLFGLWATDGAADQGLDVQLLPQLLQEGPHSLIYVYVYECVYIRVYKCVYIYIYMYTHIHVYVYI